MRKPFGLTSSRAATSLFLLLPPHLRVSASNQWHFHPHTRAFSASAPRKISLVEIAVAGPSALLDSLHAIGLPWYAALPASALVVRGGLVYYFSSLPARRVSQIHAHLAPLAALGANMRARTPRDEHRRKKMPQLMAMIDMRMRRMWYFQSQLHRLGKAFDAPVFHSRRLLNFGLLIAFTEAIRMKCGTREGLLPLVLSPFEWLAKEMRTGPSSISEPKTAGIAISREVEQTTVLNETHPSTGSSSIETLAQPISLDSTTSSYFDPTFHTEGLSWCLDLTSPDPTLILPIAVSTIMAATIILRKYMVVKRKPTESKPSRAPNLPANISPEVRQILSAPPPRLWPLRADFTLWERLGLSVSLLFFFAALKIPAAILLYLVPSLMINWVTARWLEYKMPIIPPITPCQRPMKYRIR